MTALLILQGCSSEQDSLVSLNILKMNFKNKKEISVDDKLTDISISFQPLLSNCIYFIDPNSKNLSKLNVISSHLSVICKLEEFDRDSERFSVNEQVKEIYLFNSEHVKAYDFNGKLKWQYKFRYYNNGFVVQINNNNIPIVRNGKLYCHYVKDNVNSYKDSIFFKAPIQIEINQKSGKAQFSKVFYPSSYSDNCYGMNYAPDRLELINNLQLFTFAYSDSAYVYNTITKKVEAHFFGSYKKHEFEFIPFHEIKNLNENVFFEQFFRTPKYIFTKAAPLSGYNLRRLAVMDKKTKKMKETLVIYDRDFNYVGESINGFKSFINVDSEKGLYSVKFNLEKKCLETYQLSW